MLVVVSGQARKVGKSSVVAGLIRGLTEARWTAVKITTHPHGLPLAGGYRMIREVSKTDSDTGRYLAAGARAAWWLTADAEGLAAAVEQLQGIVDESPNTILESNSVVDLIPPDLLLMVTDPTRQDWKESARRHLGRADAVILTADVPSENYSYPTAAAHVPQFRVSPPEFATAELLKWVSGRLNWQPGVPQRA